MTKIFSRVLYTVLFTSRTVGRALAL